jgi:glycosyltransferase involved in cell wall biosynthesis
MGDVIVNKVVYISSRPPFPQIGGREHMIIQSLKFLVEDFDVYVICFHGKGEVVDVKAFEAIGVSSVEPIELPSMFRVMRNLLFRPNYSIQENLYFSPFINEKISEHITTLQPKVIVADMLRSSQYVLNKEQRIVVDLDDILSKRYQKMLDLGAEHSSLGTFSERIPAPFRWLEGLVRKFAIKFERNRILTAEVRAVSKADAIILTSPLEAEYVNGTYNTGKATGISQCVTVSNQVRSGKGSNLLFIGNMTTAQNLASLQLIATQILPIIGKHQDTKLLVVGRYDDRTEKISKSNDLVELLGFVDDITDVASECAVALMPVAFGTGVKTKVLDAMGMGLPVVTNTVGAEGIGIENGVHAVVNDSSEVLARETIDLILNRDKAESISESGRNYVAVNHSFKNLQERYSRVIKGSLQKGEYS